MPEGSLRTNLNLPDFFRQFECVTRIPKTTSMLIALIQAQYDILFSVNRRIGGLGPEALERASNEGPWVSTIVGVVQALNVCPENRN